MKVTSVRDVEFGQWSSTVLDLREEGYDYFDFLTAVDQLDAADREGPEAVPGWDVVVHLLCSADPGRGSALVRTRAPEGLAVPSITAIFAGAAWHERETHEMFGIEFDGFDDGTGLGMRPLLLPDGFQGHPLRKSFLLAARASKPWPGAKEPGEGHGDVRAGAPGRRRVQAPGVPDPEWGPREH